MSEYAATRRIIIDGPVEDFEKCLNLAKGALRDYDEGAVWGYWSEEDENFQAIIRHNKQSVSVEAVRKVDTARHGDRGRVDA